MKWIENLSGTGLALSFLIVGCTQPTASADPEAPSPPPPPPPPATQPATQPDDAFEPEEEEAEPEDDNAFFGINVPLPGEVRPPAAQPANEPDPEPPVAAEPAVDPQAVAVLEQLEAQGALIQNLTARLTYDKVQGVFGQEQRRFGDFWYEPPPAQPAHHPQDAPDRVNPRFAVRFDGLRIGGDGKPLQSLNEWYIFDGQWLLERDHRKKTATRRELVAAGEAIDTLNPDGLPLPLPIKADELLKRYDVTLDQHDNDATVLTLVPRLRDPESGAQSVVLRFVPEDDGQTLTPDQVKISMANGDETTVSLNEVKYNTRFRDRVFDTGINPRAVRGWDVQALPLEQDVVE
ncbi:MAG: outer membrane lipoprotein carrier protein LolA [Planctomycetota bacterium]